MSLCFGNNNSNKLPLVMLKWSAHWAYFLLVWKNDRQKILAYILFVKGKIKDKDKKEEQLFSEIRNKLPFLLYHPTPSQNRFHCYHSHRMEQRTRENPHPASREALGSTKMKRKKNCENRGYKITIFKW